jgi:tetratricopeptide (TPR) repeat protein
MVSIKSQIKIHSYRIANKNNLKSILWLANYYEKNNNKNKMLKFYRLAVKRKDVEAMFKLGTYYKEREDFGNMKKYYWKIIKGDGKYIICNNKCVCSIMSLIKAAFSNLLSYYFDEEKNYNMIKKLLFLGVISFNNQIPKLYHLINYYEKLCTVCNECNIKHIYNENDIINQFVIFLYEELEKVKFEESKKRCIELLNTCFERYSNDNALYVLILHYKKNNMFDEMKKYLIRGANLNNEMCILHLGNYYENNNNNQEALEKYKLCFDMYQSDISLESIMNLLFREKKYDEIIGYENIIKNNKKYMMNMNYLINLGYSYLKLKKYDKMIDYFTMIDNVTMIDKQDFIQNYHNAKLLILKYYELVINDYEIAYEHYIKIDSNQFDEEKRKIIFSFEKKYDILKKLIDMNQIVNENLSCPICCENKNVFMALKCCKKQMCKTCVQGIIKKNGFICPFCRKKHIYNCDSNEIITESFYDYISDDEEDNSYDIESSGDENDDEYCVYSDQEIFSNNEYDYDYDSDSGFELD